MSNSANALAILADFGCRHARAIVVGSLVFLLTAPLFLIGLELDSDVARAIPYEDPVGRTYRESRELFGDSNQLVIDLRHTGVEIAQLDSLTDRLATRIRSWDDIAHVDIRALSFDDKAETALRLRAALLNSDPAVLADFASRFTEDGMRRQLLRSRKRLIALDDPRLRRLVTEDVLGVRDVLANFQKTQVGWRDRYVSSPYFDDPDGRSRLILVQPRGSAEDGAYCRELLARIDQAMGNLTSELPSTSSLEYRLAGVHVLTADSTKVLLDDLGIITVVATALLFAMLWLAFGRLRATLICFLPLVVAQIGVLLIARFFFNPIHFMTVGFAAVVVGLGLDVGLHLTGRFAQFAADSSTEDAIRRTLSDCGPPVLIGAVSTAVAFLSLLVTENHGLVQFGLLTAIGLFLTLAVTLFLFPALACILAPRPSDAAGLRLRGSPTMLLRFVAQRPQPAFAMAILMVLLSIPFAARFRFSENILHFFPDDVPALTVGDEIAKVHGQSLVAATQLITRTPDLASAMLTQRRLDQQLEAMIGEGRVGAFQSPSLLVPYELERLDSLAWKESGDAVRSSRARFFEQLDDLRFRDVPSFEDYYNMLVSAVDDMPATPEAMLARSPRLKNYLHQGSDGVRLQTQVVAATAKQGLRGFDPNKRRELTAQLRSVNLPPGAEVQVSGLVQVYDRSNERLLSDFSRVSWIALVLVGLVVALYFRRLAPTLFTFLPLAGALPVTLAAMYLAGVQVMPSAIGFAAIILGVGIDDAVHLLARSHGGAADEMPQVLQEIGAVITLTSLSTIIGFGSLGLSRLLVLSSLGIVIAVGVAACWFFSVFLVPAATLWIARKRAGPAAGTLIILLSLSPAQSSAQTKTAAQLMDEMAETLDSVEAVSCEIRQLKTLEQLDGPVHLQGPLLFQKPHFIKLELSGDENLSIFSDGQSIWLVDRDLQEVDTFKLEGADQQRQLARLLPPLFYMSREEIEQRFDITATPPDIGRHRLEMTPKVKGRFPFERLQVDLGDTARVLKMRVEFSNGDAVETSLDGCRNRPRTSLEVFKYRGSGD